jgi:hypothetical protein
MAKHAQPPRTPRPPAPKDPAHVARAAEIGEMIGRELKAMFDDVVAEPVPEEFRELLEELERKARNS